MLLGIIVVVLLYILQKVITSYNTKYYRYIAHNKYALMNHIGNSIYS